MHGRRMERAVILAGALAALNIAGASSMRQVSAADAARDFTQWDKDISEFQKQDSKRLFPPGEVVFVGSSSVRLWDLPKWFGEATALNRGFGGSQICDSVHFVDELVLRHKPRLVVLYAGDNDVAAGKSADEVHADFQAFTASVHKALPETRIVFISIKPSLARWEQRDTQQAANKLIAADCEADPLLDFVDVWPEMLDANGTPKKELYRDDGLHMSDAGYAVWVELTKPYLEKQD